MTILRLTEVSYEKDDTPLYREVSFGAADIVKIACERNIGKQCTIIYTHPAIKRSMSKRRYIVKEGFNEVCMMVNRQIRQLAQDSAKEFPVDRQK